MSTEEQSLNLIVGGGGAIGGLIIKSIWDMIWDKFKKTDKIDPMEARLTAIEKLLIKIETHTEKIPNLEFRVGSLEANQKTLFTRIDEQRRIVSETKTNGGIPNG